jgi:hypothetical protein
MELYRPEGFEALTSEPWDERRARTAIGAIVADVDAAYRGDELWPADEWDAWTLPLPVTNLYVGAAGVVWGLDELRRRGHAESSLDLAAVARQALERWRAEPGLPRGIELPEPAESALFAGESGIIAVAHRLAPSGELADALYAHVRANARNEANELMWGAPGTMLAARALRDATGEERWADAWRESADELRARRDADGLWTQHLYGEQGRGLTPLHGLVGNVAALGEGQDAAAAALARTAVVDDGFANWPLEAGEPLLLGDGQIRLQWCAGAGGVVACAAPYLDEELLLAGAELLWHAGPHGPEKGSSICHGTAGTGYAFLKVFERTGDERWLDRARRFAVHALAQVERARAARGRGRYSLFTGDVGVALFAGDCVEGRAAYPILDGL